MSSDQPTWDEKIHALRTEYSDLQDAISMADVTQELGDIATEITGLPGEIDNLRQRGYVFAGYLENKAQVLFEQWDEIRSEVRHTVNREVERMQEQFEEVRDLWRQL
ncbi:MAG: hypothetical protein GYB65_21565, partial [Chloroflexi bacterium]|nr:hypothetical protein [Chloroflexota bacterium]